MVDTEGLLTELCVAWAQTELNSPLEVVERPFAWIDRDRRLSKDYEALPMTTEAMIWAAFGTTMLRRLAKRRTS